MSAMDPDEVATTGPPAEAAVGTEVLEGLAWLDLSDARDRFARGVDADAPYYVASQTGMEYRRFLLLRLTYPRLNIPAPPLLDGYWRLHAADRSKFASDCESLVAGTDVSPDTLDPPHQPCERPPGRRSEISTSRQSRRSSTASATARPAWAGVHIRLPSALDESTRDALREEAFEQRGCATELRSAAPRIERGSVSGFGRFCYAHAGPLLHDVHRNGSVSRLIAAKTGAIVTPAGAYYNYYRSGDCISIHTDPYGDELVLLTLLSGPVEPLHCHLDLRTRPGRRSKTWPRPPADCPTGAPRSRSAASRSCSLASVPTDV